MEILLFDMDGVLLEPAGYQHALSETVAMMGHALGYREVHLSSEDIEIFEAAGVTSEWEASAVCTALLLDRLWTIEPGVELPCAPPLPEIGSHRLRRPDFRAFFRAMGREDLDLPGTLRAERLLLQGTNHTSKQRAALRSILRNADQIERSLTHRLFQELVLGSQALAETYALEPTLHCAGMLYTHDRSALSDESLARLRAWLSAPEHHGVVFTNRPSRPPEGFFDTPEAEIGLELVGLPELPIVGGGGLKWLSAKRNVAGYAFLKPSPVHALSALSRAAGTPHPEALLAAADLWADGQGLEHWRLFEGAGIRVFEDAAKGIRSALGAARVLGDIGVHVGVELYGITASPIKAAALQEAGAPVFPTLPEALRDAGVTR